MRRPRRSIGRATVAVKALLSTYHFGVKRQFLSLDGVEKRGEDNLSQRDKIYIGLDNDKNTSTFALASFI